jgi:hypothetical protein
LSDFDEYSGDRADLIEGKIPDDIDRTCLDKQSIEAVYERLFSDIDGEPEPDARQNDCQRTPAEIITEALRFPLAPLQSPNIAMKLANQYRLSIPEIIGRRAIMAAWATNPGLLIGTVFEGAPSLRTLARTIRVSAPLLSEISSEFSALFKIENRAQAHGNWRRKRRAAEKKIETPN